MNSRTALSAPRTIVSPLKIARVCQRLQLGSEAQGVPFPFSGIVGDHLHLPGLGDPLSFPGHGAVESQPSPGGIAAGTNTRNSISNYTLFECWQSQNIHRGHATVSPIMSKIIRSPRHEALRDLLKARRQQARLTQDDVGTKM